MPVRDQSELIDRLDRELAWRKRELTVLAFDVASGSQVTALRAGICLLYAHWEGFIKVAAQSYLEYIANRRLKYGEMRRNFWAIGFRAEIRRVVEQRNTAAQLALVDAILDARTSRISSSIGDAIDTKSNLNAKAFKDILVAVGFDTKAYDTKEKFFDARLLANRNRIAHGEHLEIEPEDYAELKEIVVNVMDQFRDDIENAVVNRAYRLQ